MEKALGVYQPVTDDTTSIISYCESSLVLSLVVEMGYPRAYCRQEYQKVWLPGTQ
jgi:hypothetical protein